MKKRLSINLNQKIVKEITEISSGGLIIGVFEGPFSDELKIIDQETNGTLKKLRKLGELEGKLGQSIYLPALSGVKAQRTYLVGCGKEGKKLSRQEAPNLLSWLVILFPDLFFHSHTLLTNSSLPRLSLLSPSFSSSLSTTI